MIVTIADVVRTHRDSLGPLPALHADGMTVSHQDLDRRSDEVAGALVQSGIQRGDRVAFLGKNSAEYFFVLVATAKLGAILVPLNWRLAYAELSAILLDCEPATIIVDDEFLAVADTLRADVAVGAAVLSADITAPVAWPSPPTLPISGNETALLVYTSGTTGRPKGVIVTHAGLLESLRILASEAGIEQQSVSLCTLPVFHIGGTAWALAGLWAGCPTVLMRESVPEQIVQELIAHQVTVAIAVPAVIQRVVDAIDAGLPSPTTLQRLYYGGGPISTAVLEQALSSLPCDFVQGFGMTELPLITVLPPEEHRPGARLSSCGRLVPNTEARIVDPASMKDVPTGGIGELWVRSDRSMAGYWRQPTASAAALTEDGWLRTGDAVRVDVDGYYYLQDRLKDVIISGGENIYSAEVENVLMSHPLVDDCAVIGVPSERWGETVRALVVRSNELGASEAELIAFCRAALAGYKCPTSVVAVAEIPRTPAGKAKKHELRRLHSTPS